MRRSFLGLAVAVGTVLSVSVLLGASSSAIPEVYSADVVIVGGGGAGMTAAIEARRAGASVILLEKSGSLGGNTLVTQSGLNASETPAQKSAEVSFTNDQFARLQTNERAKADLVQFLVKNSASTVSWLEAQGLKFVVNPKQSAQSHRPADGRTLGVALVDTLSASLQKVGATVLYNTTATELVADNHQVTGVLARTKDGHVVQVRARAVVLTTGGYGQNAALVGKYRPDLAGAITDEIAPTSGDGLTMAQAVGAQAVDLDQFTTFPIVEAKTHQMIFPMYLPADAIFVDHQGRRFVAEGFDDPKTITALLAQRTAWAVFDSRRLASAPGLQSLQRAGALVTGSSIEALARSLKLDPAILQASVQRWNADVAVGKDSQFGRTKGMEHKIDQGPFYAAEVGVGIHYCLGGLLINTQTQVLDLQGRPIAGLYAAGEVTGGVHGTTKVDGSTVADTVIYGRQSGAQSAAYALSLGQLPLVVPSVSAVSSVAATGAHYKDGSFEGKGSGRGGDVRVRVTVSSGHIQAIQVLSADETGAKMDAINHELIPSILAKQSVDVDVVSGATMSSEGVLAAVADALAAH